MDLFYHLLHPDYRDAKRLKAWIRIGKQNQASRLLEAFILNGCLLRQIGKHLDYVIIDRRKVTAILHLDQAGIWQFP